MSGDCKSEICEIIDRISNEEYLELIRRFAERLLGAGEGRGAGHNGKSGN